VKLGDLILAEKEASKLVMKVIGSSHVAKPKWEVVGKAHCSRWFRGRLEACYEEWTLEF
jgi:hypothetical protein